MIFELARLFCDLCSPTKFQHRPSQRIFVYRWQNAKSKEYSIQAELTLDMPAVDRIA
ncbi:hypothetical protein [Novosphingobium sp. ZW T3_23]|uniref:hypothetical protein n=1 Tax=Novosphingobium sp. ZW T3_23 TaxID=3378084 RepID=UPI0038550716